MDKFYKVKGSILFKLPIQDATNKLYGHYVRYGKLIIDMRNVYVSFKMAKIVFRFIATALGSDKFLKNTKIINISHKATNILEGFILEGFEKHKTLGKP